MKDPNDHGTGTDGHSSLTVLSTALLKGELSRRQQNADRPACGSGHVKDSYNTPLHVAALIIILVLSTLACSFPIVVRRFPRLPVPHHFLFLSRHFGTGVLIATAFVHLLPTAFVSLTDPCLPPFWNQGYPAMAGFIAMVSVLVVVGIEMFFATRGAGHMHDSDYGALKEQESGLIKKHRGVHKSEQGINGHARLGGSRTQSWARFQQETVGGGGIALRAMGSSRENLMGGQPPYGGSREENHDESGEGDNSDLDLDEVDTSAEVSSIQDSSKAKVRGYQLANGQLDRRSHNGADHDRSLTGTPSASPAHTEQQDQQKALLQCLLLEAGILFHSVFIGMALSVATGTPFIVLLIAISFHQTFEGLALGSRIAAVKLFSASSPKPWLMALAYGTTTPIGQAIGLLVHNLYDPASQTGLLMVGVMNAISSGLLLFAGLVELLAEDFLSDKSYVSLRGKRRIQACSSVFAGSMLMALVGAWA